MIIRLMGQQGQWRLNDALQAELNAIDEQLDADLKADAEADFGAHLQAMYDLVRSKGTLVAEDDFQPSDAFVPPVDITLEELRGLLTSDGLIPG